MAIRRNFISFTSAILFLLLFSSILQPGLAAGCAGLADLNDCSYCGLESEAGIDVASSEVRRMKIDAGDAFEFGKAAGTALSSEYSATLRIFRAAAIEGGYDLQEMRQRTQYHIQYLEANYPQFAERIQGISAGTGIPAEELFEMGLHSSEVFGLKYGCTNGAEAYPATSNGEVFNHWQLDMGYYFKAICSVPLFIVSDAEPFSYVSFGLPGVFEFAMLNERGLSMTMTACGLGENGDVNENGLTAMELSVLVMQNCENIYETEATLRSVERQSTGSLTSNGNLLFADALGGIASIEYTHDYFAACYGDSGVVAQANHQQFLDFNRTGAPDDSPAGYNSSWVRISRMWEMQRNYRGGIDLNLLTNAIQTDHENGVEMAGSSIGGFDSVCRHCYDQASKTVKGQNAVAFEPGFGGTNAAFTVQPRQFTIWFCPGHPCVLPFLNMSFAEDLGASIPEQEIIIGSHGLSEISVDGETVFNITVTNAGGYRTIMLGFNSPEGSEIRILSSALNMTSGLRNLAAQQFIDWSEVGSNIFTIPGGASVNVTIQIISRDSIPGSSIEIIAEEVQAGGLPEQNEFAGTLSSQGGAGSLPSAGIGGIIGTILVSLFFVSRKRR